MNILIVDDEELTRNGLISSIAWEKLGIEGVFQGRDGEEGLRLFQRIRPEILLTDVRMPRRNGVEMARLAREISPECHIIFMSGYSDKEYLKAAIRLKAVNYIEKPIVTEEVESALFEAVTAQKQWLLDRDSARQKRRQKSMKLALATLEESENMEQEWLDQMTELNYAVKKNTQFVSFVIRFTKRQSSSLEFEEIERALDAFVQPLDFGYFWGVGQEENIIVHFFSDDRNFFPALLQNASRLVEGLGRFCSLHLLIGQPVTGLQRISLSCQRAMDLAQDAFFCEAQEVLVYQRGKKGNSPGQRVLETELTRELENQDRAGALAFARRLYDSLSGKVGVSVNYAKDIYYKSFMELLYVAQRQQIPWEELKTDSAVVLEFVSQSRLLSELHRELEGKIDLFFQLLSSREKENSTVYLIKSFIGRNFYRENLSVKDISEHVYLSPSYACTVFKNETGKTINQYLTEYRIEKAKALLLDPRFKITDISSRVGYCDGNYFGKSFKKLLGLSPSEYRERYGK